MERPLNLGILLSLAGAGAVQVLNMEKVGNHLAPIFLVEVLGGEVDMLHPVTQVVVVQGGILEMEVMHGMALHQLSRGKGEPVVVLRGFMVVVA